MVHVTTEKTFYIGSLNININIKKKQYMNIGSTSDNSTHPKCSRLLLAFKNNFLQLWGRKTLLLGIKSRAVYRCVFPIVSKIGHARRTCPCAHHTRHNGSAPDFSKVEWRAAPSTYHTCCNSWFLCFSSFFVLFFLTETFIMIIP